MKYYYSIDRLNIKICRYRCKVAVFKHFKRQCLNRYFWSYVEAAEYFADLIREERSDTSKRLALLDDAIQKYGHYFKGTRRRRSI